MGLSHVDDTGQARMVDVSHKSATARKAVAAGIITLGREAMEAVIENSAAKGDVLGTARLAGIMAAKKTPDLIPLCHPLPLSSIKIDLDIDRDASSIIATATAKTVAVTGVEMEALTAVSVALLTIYDMLKAVSKSMRISDIKLLHKSGGKSGEYKV